jgi:hypothetical protein
MPLSDVIRTASSEIEQYDRVQLELRADPLMHGFNALAAAHLLAELLENATLFSEPGTPVVVSTGVSGDLVTVQVIDQGLGMTPEELAEANATIGATAATDAIGAQRLGLFVVARLARRLGAHVRLERASGHHSSSGTVAAVAFPAALFTSHDPALTGQPAAAPESRQVSGPATGVVPEAPVAVPVDLAALTDGATSTGLPKRRTSGAQAPSEPEVVLPAPAEATLAPEIAAAAEVWTPQIPAAGPAALPSRTALPSRGEAAGLPTRTPAAPVAPESEPAAAAEPAGPRSGLFAGFRGRDALPRLTELPITDDEPTTPEASAAAPVTEDAATDEPEAPEAPEAEVPELEIPALEADEVDAPAAWTTDAWAPAGWDEPVDLPAADPHAEELARPLTAPVPIVTAEALAAAQVPALAPDPEPETAPEPAAAAPLVVPGLIPDERDAAADDWSWSAAAQDEVPSLDVPQVAETADPAWSSAEPWAPAEPAAETWAPAEPSGWADLPAPMGQPVAGLPAPVEPAALADAVDAVDPIPPAEPQWSAPEPVAAVPDLPAEPQPALPTRASAFHAAAAPVDPPADVPAAPQPFAAPADAAPLPDFAALVQGDGREEAHRERPRKKQRSLFSFGRRKQPEAPAAPVTPAAPSAERPAWPSSAAWSAGEETPAATWSAPAPVAAPVPTPAPVAAPAPVEPEPVAGPWSVEPAAAPEPVASAPAWAPQTPQAPVPAPASTGWAPQEPAAQAPAVPLWAISPETEPTLPAWAPQEPAPAAAAPGWSSALPTRTPAPVPPPVEEPGAAPTVPAVSAPRDVSAWASAWSPEGGSAGTGSAWATGAAATPGPTAPQHSGALDAEAAAMLAQRADIQEQALSELSQLSAYRPTVVDRPASGSLTRRVPTAIPAAPEIEADTAGTTARDADGLRSRLSSFQSGTRRGRRAQAGSESGDVPAPGAEPTPDPQPAPSSPTW